MKPDIHASLLRAARTAMARAYAPYSGFRVGAAVLGRSGAIYAGCNVENASYPVTICAERGALSAAVAAGETAIEAVLIITGEGTQCPPCGMCRQALHEFGPDMLVMMAASDGSVRQSRMSSLLPEAFGPDSLSDR